MAAKAGGSSPTAMRRRRVASAWSVRSAAEIATQAPATLAYAPRYARAAAAAVRPGTKYAEDTAIAVPACFVQPGARCARSAGVFAVVGARGVTVMSDAGCGVGCSTAVSGAVRPGTGAGSACAGVGGGMYSHRTQAAGAETRSTSRHVQTAADARSAAVASSSSPSPPWPVRCSGTMGNWNGCSSTDGGSSPSPHRAILAAPMSRAGCDADDGASTVAAATVTPAVVAAVVTPAAPSSMFAAARGLDLARGAVGATAESDTDRRRRENVMFCGTINRADDETPKDAVSDGSDLDFVGACTVGCGLWVGAGGSVVACGRRTAVRVFVTYNLNGAVLVRSTELLGVSALVPEIHEAHATGYSP
mmetsp:Transcript_30295/g.93475  ORF Transcript_30295/g.93475 Transcript_30295/m.93475 type:complete len:362 (+) Transcript_30295:282-1367(+)